MSVLHVGHLAGECSGPHVKNGRSSTGQHHEVLFSPDNTVSKFPVVSSRRIFSEHALDIIKDKEFLDPMATCAVRCTGEPNVPQARQPQVSFIKHLETPLLERKEAPCTEHLLKNVTE